MNRFQRYLASTKTGERLIELSDLLNSAANRAFRAQQLSQTQGTAKNYNVMNHRVDIVLFNKKKFWFMKRRGFEV